jgi:predicted DNA-binding antitoxin AbrB/MazE fold protein
VAGSVRELRSQELAGQEKAHALAKLETSRGLARVDLGPETEVQSLNLKEGDEVAVVGTLGRINGRSVLMAHEIHAGKETIHVERPRSAEMRRFRGTIEDYRNVAFEDQDKEHVVARVRLDDGRVATVNLGAEDKLQSADLENGTEIQILARPGEINGESALIAEEIWANNQNIDIEHADNRQRFEEARARGQRPGQPSAQSPMQSRGTPGGAAPTVDSTSERGTLQPSTPGVTQPGASSGASPQSGATPGEETRSESQPAQPASPSPTPSADSTSPGSASPNAGSTSPESSRAGADGITPGTAGRSTPEQPQSTPSSQ